ncbi:hypothetical protein [Arthrobacter sp. TMS1-12-1]
MSKVMSLLSQVRIDTESCAGGIVDIDPHGRTGVVDTRAQWDTYMAENFTAMRAANAVRVW